MTTKKMTLLSSLARKRKSSDNADYTSDIACKRVCDVISTRPQLIQSRPRMSPLLNTPKQRKDEKRRLLRVSLGKLRDIDNAELCLHRAVLVHNTVKKLQKELRQEKFYHSPRSNLRLPEKMRSARRLVRRRVTIAMASDVTDSSDDESEDDSEEESPAHSRSLVDHFALADLDSPMMDSSSTGRVLQRTAMLDHEPQQSGDYTDIDTYKYSRTESQRITYSDIDVTDLKKDYDIDNDSCSLDGNKNSFEGSLMVEPPQSLIGQTGYFSVASAEDSSHLQEEQALDLTPASTINSSTSTSYSNEQSTNTAVHPENQTIHTELSSAFPPSSLVHSSTSLVHPSPSVTSLAHTTCSEAYNREQSFLAGTSDSTFLSLLQQPWTSIAGALEGVEKGAAGDANTTKQDVVDPVVGALMHVLASTC